MAENNKGFLPNRLTNLFYNINRFTLWCGYPSFWVQNPTWYNSYQIVNRHYTHLMTTLLILFMMTEMGALFTQKNLSEKQIQDRNVFIFSHPILYSYGNIITFYRNKLRALLFSLAVDLKEFYNDEVVERETIKKATFYSTAFVGACSSALFLYGTDALIQVLRKDATFVTVITMWPDTRDQSQSAQIVRIIAYIVWYIFMMRPSAVFSIVTSVIVCLSCQYKNLQSYFQNLNLIFEDNNLSRTEKERKYEDGIKIGIELHSKTLRCAREAQTTCSFVFSGQIILNIFVIVMIMSQMVNSERTLASTFATVSTGSTMLVSTGFFMWNAGDVTVEASHLSEAMFKSGWHNCQHESSVRIRKLLVVAMTQAQQPVVVRGLGILPLSYESYVSIVKLSYSVFSVLF